MRDAGFIGCGISREVGLVECGLGREAGFIEDAGSGVNARFGGVMRDLA